MIAIKRYLIIISACMIILIPGISYSAEAKTVDVALVMDSTGSMKKTDPMFLRITAAKLFVTLLNKNDRSGVVSFDESAAILSGLTQLNSGSNRNVILQAIEKITSAGLHTNLFEALNSGLEMLGEGEGIGEEKIIVLMSDGLMDTGDAEKDKILIEKLKTALTKKLIDKGIKVYAIAFTEGADRQLLEKLSKQTGGFYNLALTDKDFHMVFTSIFESLKRPDMLPMSENGFLIDKSVDEVTIVATKNISDTTIQLASPDGRKYSSKSKPPDTEWLASANFDMMTIKKPAEGKWQILFSSGKNNKAYVITNLNLQTNFRELYPLFGQTIDIKAWLERDGKTIKENDVLERISLSFELSKPDGTAAKLEPLSKGDGIFEKRIELYTAGNYRLRFLVDGKTFQREKTFEFKVSDAKESKEDIKFRQSIKKRGEQKPAGPKPEDKFSWRKVIIQFVTINLIAGIIIFAYFKSGVVKNFINTRLKKGKKL